MRARRPGSRGRAGSACYVLGLGLDHTGRFDSRDEVGQGRLNRCYLIFQVLYSTTIDSQNRFMTTSAFRALTLETRSTTLHKLTHLPAHLHLRIPNYSSPSSVSPSRRFLLSLGNVYKVDRRRPHSAFSFDGSASMRLGGLISCVDVHLVIGECRRERR